MTRPIPTITRATDRSVHLTNFGPSTAPVPPAPGPLLLFIQQGQLALVYGPWT